MRTTLRLQLSCLVGFYKTVSFAFAIICIAFRCNSQVLTFNNSGWNGDVIAEFSPSPSSTSIVVDGPGNYVYFNNNYPGANSRGLPSNGATTAFTGIPFQLRPANVNNVLQLATTNSSGTLTLSTPTTMNEAYILACVGSGSTTMRVSATYTDNTTAVWTNSVSVADWFNGSNAAYTCGGRIIRSNSASISGTLNNPRIYGYQVTNPQPSKTVVSFTFTKLTSSGWLNIFGASKNNPDSDGDGTPDVNDGCPSDPNKITPGLCGCGIADTDTDVDGTPDCNDSCPNDPGKIVPGICGCGVADTDFDNDGIPACNDCNDNNASISNILTYTYDGLCYPTLNDALAAVPQGTPGTVMINNDVDPGTISNIPEDVTVTVAANYCWTNSASLTVRGTIQMQSGALLKNVSGGVIKGTGIINGNLQNVGGTVSPGIE